LHHGRVFKARVQKYPFLLNNVREIFILKPMRIELERSASCHLFLFERKLGDGQRTLQSLPRF